MLPILLLFKSLIKKTTQHMLASKPMKTGQALPPFLIFFFLSVWFLCSALIGKLGGWGLIPFQ